MRTTLLSLLATPWVMAGELIIRNANSSSTRRQSYATYQGYYDETYGLNIWKRYGFPVETLAHESS